MIEDKYRDKLNSGIITLEREIKTLQQSIDDNKDKIANLSGQIKNLAKDKDIHEIMLWKKNINQLKQQESYNTLAMGLKQKEQQRLKNELNLYDGLQRQEQQRLKNMHSIKFVKEGEEEKLKKEITKMNKDWDRYNHNRNKVYPKKRESFSKQIDATKAFVKNADKNLNLPSICDRNFNLIREKNNIENKKKLENFKNAVEKLKKDKDVEKKVSELEQVNKEVKKVYNRVLLHFNRFQMYRWRYKPNGAKIKIKNQKPPMWRLYAEAEKGFPQL